MGMGGVVPALWKRLKNSVSLSAIRLRSGWPEGRSRRAHMTTPDSSSVHLETGFRRILSAGLPGLATSSRNLRASGDESAGSSVSARFSLVFPSPREAWPGSP